MLYPRAMGAAFDTLPAPLRAFHSVEDTALYTGTVTITHGHPLARLIAKSGGMPGTPGTLPFRFRATRDGTSEIWERRFGDHMTRSLQWLHAPGIVAERIGTSEFLMAPTPSDTGLHIPVTSIRGFGLPVPNALITSCEGTEGITQTGAITFDVHCRLRGLGLIIRYQGQMQRAD